MPNQSPPALAVSIDERGRVVEVQVLDISALRSGRDLQDALTGAIAQALVGKVDPRLRADLEDLSPDELRQRLLTRPPRRKIDTSRAASSHRRATRREGTKAAPPPSTSENGFLTLTGDDEGRPIHVEVEAEWLAACRPEHLRSALQQANRGLMEAAS